MAYKITSKCISCKLCLSACPTGAIKIVDGSYWIDPNLCTNCGGTAYSVAQCVASCPTYDGCVQEPKDYWESWFTTYNKLIAKLTKKQDYWDNWYNFYSQKFSLAMQKHQASRVEA
ncbi:MAG: 4Fe-4S binding protein [Iphinoe sp. HA4291-MV1]|jgi:ferredoxin|nr:4Fe-4S binding protein [Iphinoe sp. HA4291-MV1]